MADAPTPESKVHAHLKTHAPASFTRDGVLITLLSKPEPLLNRQGKAVGIKVQANASDKNGPLPEGDGWHHFVNPPTQHNGKVDPATAFQAILFDSVIATARHHGWKG